MAYQTPNPDPCITTTPPAGYYRSRHGLSDFQLAAISDWGSYGLDTVGDTNEWAYGKLAFGVDLLENRQISIPEAMRTQVPTMVAMQLVALVERVLIQHARVDMANRSRDLDLMALELEIIPDQVGPTLTLTLALTRQPEFDPRIDAQKLF